MLWHAQCSVCEGQVYTTALVIYLNLHRPLIANSTLPVLTSPHMSLVLTYLSPLPASFTPCATLHTFTYGCHHRMMLLTSSQVVFFVVVLFLFSTTIQTQFALYRRKTIYIKQKNRVLVKRDIFCSVDDCDTTTECEWWPLCPPFLHHLSPMPPPTMAEGVKWQVDKNQ